MTNIICKCGHDIDKHQPRQYDSDPGCNTMVDAWTGTYCDCELIPSQVAAARVAELEAALEAFLIAHENNDLNSDGNELYERMIAIDAGEQWTSGEDLQAWAVEKARALLKGKQHD